MSTVTADVNLDALSAAVKASLSPLTENANRLAATISQHDTDPNVLVSQLRDDESSEFEPVRKFQEYRDKVNAKLEDETKKIDAWIRENALPTPGEDGNVDVEALKTEYRELVSKIKSGRTYLKNMDVTDEQLADLPELKTLRGTTASTSGQAGVKRPRFTSALINGEEVYDEKDGKTEGEKVRTINFTVLAAKLSKRAKSGKIDGDALRAHVYEMAGTDDLGSLAKGREFKWDQVIGDENFTVTVII